MAVPRRLQTVEVNRKHDEAPPDWIMVPPTPLKPAKSSEALKRKRDPAQNDDEPEDSSSLFCEETPRKFAKRRQLLIYHRTKDGVKVTPDATRAIEPADPIQIGRFEDTKGHARFMRVPQEKQLAPAAPVEKDPQQLSPVTPVKKSPQKLASATPAKKSPQQLASATPIKKSPQQVASAASVKKSPHQHARIVPEVDAMDLDEKPRKRPGAAAALPSRNPKTIVAKKHPNEAMNVFGSLAKEVEAKDGNEVRKVSDHKVKPMAPKLRFHERHPDVAAQIEAEEAAAQERAATKLAAQNVDTMMTDAYVTDVYVLEVREVLESEIAGITAELGGVGATFVASESQEDWWNDQDDDSDEFDTDDDDENAEDYYANDYPEDELDSDDEQDRDPYQYQAHRDSAEEDNGFNDEEEEDRALNSDDEGMDDEVLNWRKQFLH